jgi:hypothetical protein
VPLLFKYLRGPHLIGSSWTYCRFLKGVTLEIFRFLF